MRATLSLWWPRLLLIAGVAGTMAVSLPGQEKGTVEPLDEVMRYNASDDLADPVTLLQRKINAGEVKLTSEGSGGYLKSVLDALKIPVASQNLIFSKTSCQAHFTSPETPRAVYFKDNVYVGFAQGDHVLDIIAVDPKKGPIFFTLEQDASAKPTFKRASCQGCHLGTETLNVPGLLVRSVNTDAKGQPIAQVQLFISGHNNPLPERWGGWYVTGTHAGDFHLGNGFYERRKPSDEELRQNSNLTDLSSRLDVSKYPTPFSDTVSLLVLDHTVRMQNLITQAQYETSTALKERATPGMKLVDNSNWRIRNAGEALLAYMLFRDEAPLHGQVRGTSGFQEEFEKRGPKDRKGRSLFELDLKDRVFKYPCSYLIYSDSFEALPKEMKEYLWGRLGQILTGKDQTPLYAKMSPDDRKATLEILLDTKPEFREWWKEHQPKP